MSLDSYKMLINGHTFALLPCSLRRAYYGECQFPTITCVPPTKYVLKSNPFTLLVFVLFQVLLECVIASCPEAEVHWYRNNVPIQDTADQQVGAAHYS